MGRVVAGSGHQITTGIGECVPPSRPSTSRQPCWVTLEQLGTLAEQSLHAYGLRARVLVRHLPQASSQGWPSCASCCAPTRHRRATGCCSTFAARHCVGVGTRAAHCRHPAWPSRPWARTTMPASATSAEIQYGSYHSRSGSRLLQSLADLSSSALDRCEAHRAIVVAPERFSQPVVAYGHVVR